MIQGAFLNKLDKQLTLTMKISVRIQFRLVLNKKIDSNLAYLISEKIIRVQVNMRKKSYQSQQSVKSINQIINTILRNKRKSHFKIQFSNQVLNDLISQLTKIQMLD